MPSIATRLGCLLVVVSTAGAVALAADKSPAELFNELFGAEVRRVKSTADPADDIGLAAQLINAAKSANDNPALLEVLCEQAYTLASKDPTGYETAKLAMQLLGEKVPSRKKVVEARVVALYQQGYERNTGEEKRKAGELYLNHLITEADAAIAAKDYTTAITMLQRARPVAYTIRSPLKDAIAGKMEFYGVLAKSQQRVELYERRLKTNPWDKTTRSHLLSLYLEDLDNPAMAAKHVSIGGDATQKKLVPLAAKPIEQISEQEAIELGNWYEKLGRTAISQAKRAMFSRAKAYYEHYLTKHESQDVKRAAATLTLKRIGEALANAPAPPSGGASSAAAASTGKPIDVLAAIDPDRDRVTGKWSKPNKTLKVESERWSTTLLRAPFTIEGSYELQVKFIRDSDDGSFGIVLPVSDARVRLVFDYFGRAGLTEVKGEDPRRNSTGVNLSLRNGKVYTVDVAVKIKGEDSNMTAQIVAKLDGRPLLKWEGKPSDLSLSDRIRLPDEKAIGFVAFRSGFTIGGVRLKMLTGQTKTIATAAPKVDARDFRPPFRGFDRNRGRGRN